MVLPIRPCRSRRRGDEIFQVHLMADADAGRDDAEVVERARAPRQKLVAFHIAFVFELDVLLERGAVPNVSTITE